MTTSSARFSESSESGESIARALGEYPAATLYEALGKSGGMSAAIRSIVPRARLAGVAYTIRLLGAETLALLTAIEEAPAGAVLVIDTGSEGTAPTWGGTSSLAAKVRGLAGAVTNGLVRDIEEVIEIGVPIYATGACVIGTQKNHPGWRGIPVTLGGVVVHPGDFVIGDADGVVVVPAARADEALERAAVQRAKETARDERILRGEPLTVVLGLRS